MADYRDIRENIRNGHHGEMVYRLVTWTTQDGTRLQSIVVDGRERIRDFDRMLFELLEDALTYGEQRAQAIIENGD